LPICTCVDFWYIHLTQAGAVQDSLDSFNAA
jgi:hypothetical protein